MKSLRIIFMGTPDFAVPCLEALCASRHQVVGVVTALDKPAGRGRQLQAPPVKTAALAHGLPVLQPEKLRDEAFLADLRALQADVFVVVAFRMLPELVWAMPPVGCLNLHASLLPDYRGAAPINWAVVNGERETGLTTFLIEKEIDTGKILLQERIALPDDWTAGQLHDEMMQRGAALVVRTVDGLADNTIVPQPQPELAQLHAAPKIHPDTCRIDWARPAEALYHFVRGFAPFPGAFTTLEGKVLKVLFADRVPADLTAELPTGQAPGTSAVHKRSWYVATADGYLKLVRIKLEGKKEMTAAEFLNGFNPSGVVLGG